MKKTIFTLAFALGTTLGILAGSSDSVSAQLTNSKNPDVKYQTNEQSTNGGSTFGSDFNPLDLIHNVNMRRSRDAGQFAEDTDSSLNQAAQEFKRQQQQRIENPSSNSQVTPSN